MTLYPSLTSTLLNAFLLVLPLFALRFGLPSLIRKTSLSELGHFPPLERRENIALKFYFVTQGTTRRADHRHEGRWLCHKRIQILFLRPFRLGLAGAFSQWYNPRTTTLPTLPRTADDATPCQCHIHRLYIHWTARHPRSWFDGL